MPVRKSGDAIWDLRLLRFVLRYRSSVSEVVDWLVYNLLMDSY